MSALWTVWDLHPSTVSHLIHRPTVYGMMQWLLYRTCGWYLTPPKDVKHNPNYEQYDGQCRCFLLHNPVTSALLALKRITLVEQV